MQCSHTINGQMLANEDFTLVAATLTGTAPLWMYKRFYWLGGQLYNLVSGVHCAGGMTINSPAVKYIALTAIYNYQVRTSPSLSY
jgi:hypothetical protein